MGRSLDYRKRCELMTFFQHFWKSFIWSNTHLKIMRSWRSRSKKATNRKQNNQHYIRDLNYPLLKVSVRWWWEKEMLSSFTQTCCTEVMPTEVTEEGWRWLQLTIQRETTLPKYTTTHITRKWRRYRVCTDAFIGHVNSIPTIPLSTGISRKISQPYMLSLTECAWEFRNNALWCTN